MGVNSLFPNRSPVAKDRRNEDSGFALIITTLYLLFTAVLIAHHQIWIDEAYYYLLARDSESYGDMISVYNGHPHLWSTTLYLLAKIFPGILAFQILHSIFAAATVFLIVMYCPLPRVVRFLVSFGYFFLFEYNIIAKNYILGFFFFFLALVFFQKGRPMWLIALCLGIACNSHPFTLFISTAFFFYSWHNHRQQTKEYRWPALVLFTALMVLAILQIIPTSEVLSTYYSHGGPSLFSLDRLGRSLGAPAKGLLNIPDFAAGSFWNSNYIFDHYRRIGYLLSVVLFIYAAWCFRRHRDLLFLFLIPLILIMIFVYGAPLATGVRYWGYFNLMLLVCTWLYNLKSRLHADLSYLLKVVVFLQFLVSIPVVVTVLKRPFSNGGSAASALRHAQLDNLPIFAPKLAVGPPLAAYAGKKVYYPAERRFESFSYDVKDYYQTDVGFVAESLVEMRALGIDSCVLVNNRPILGLDSAGLLRNISLRAVSIHTGAIVTSENYFLYLLKLQKGDNKGAS